MVSIYCRRAYLIVCMDTADSRSAGEIAVEAKGWPRTFLNNKYVYLVVSQRAKGLSIGVNLNPDKRCNFKCVYCEVNRDVPGTDGPVHVPTMANELVTMLQQVREKKVHELSGFKQLPKELLELKEVALSGDGEPTLSPQFFDIITEVVGLRSRGAFFKIVLITNTAGLPLPEVRTGLRLLKREDEIWVKLDAGSQEYMDRVNRPDIKLSDVMGNILTIAKERPVVVQSLFPLIQSQEPSDFEIDQYVHRLQELSAAGAQISMVQVYSAHRPPHLPDCGHLALRTLSRIAGRVRKETGLRAEVF